MVRVRSFIPRSRETGDKGQGTLTVSEKRRVCQKCLNPGKMCPSLLLPPQGLCTALHQTPRSTPARDGAFPSKVPTSASVSPTVNPSLKGGFP